MKYFYSGINQVCRQILRPARAEYHYYDLGSNFSTGEVYYTRQDLDLINEDKLKLKVSVFQGRSASENCIIYLHSANGSRMEVFKFVADIIKLNYTLVAFDFSGSGMSDGDIVTYGHNEIRDLQTVVTHFQANVKSIILWGRSMGSVVALLYMEKYKNQLVKGMILDSPFVCLQDVVVQMASKRTRIPNFILSSLSSYVSSELKKQSGFSLEEINCLQQIQQVRVPAFFITSKQDTVVPAEQTEKLFQSYLGQKQIHYTGEDHNSTRENSLIERILLWLKKRSPIFEPRSQQVQTATPHALGVGARIKNKIMQSQIPIKQIDLNCFCERVKERSATFDDNRCKNNSSVSPRRQMKEMTPEQKYNQMLQTQRSLYVDRSISANKINQSIDFNGDNYFSNKPMRRTRELKDILRVSNNSQNNYFNQNSHFKPVVFNKVPNKTRDSSQQRREDGLESHQHYQT